MWTDRCVDRQMCSPDDSEMQLTGKAQPLSAGRAACWVSWEPEEGVRVMGPESLQVQRPWLEGSCGAGGAFLDPAPNHGASILKAPPPTSWLLRRSSGGRPPCGAHGKLR